MKRIIPWVAIAVLLAGCGSPSGQNSGKNQSAGTSATDAATGGAAKAAASGDFRTDTAAGISFHVPPAWQSSPPTSSMRAAQYMLPSAKAGDEAPELVVYFFGHGSGGTADANIERWIGQMQQPDGKDSKSAAVQATQQVGDFKVTTVRLNGTYASSMMPGMSSTQPKAGFRMWGAVVEASGGPWFFKATGPQASMEAAEPALDALVASLAAAK